MPTSNDRRQWVRYPVHRDTVCRVIHLEWDGPRAMPVCNVSVNGAEILADRLLKIGQEIDIVLVNDTRRVTCRRRAHVKFYLKSETGIHRVGVMFGASLSFGEVEGLCDMPNGEFPLT